MSSRLHVVALSLGLLFSPPIAGAEDAAFVAWANEQASPLPAEDARFAALDDAVRRARLIGVGESVHESEPFLTFRLLLLQDLVRRHRVTALLLESGLPEAAAIDDYVHGRTASVDYDAALPGGLGTLLTMHQVFEWLRTWNLGDGRANPVSVYGADVPARSGSMVPALDQLAARATGDRAIQSLIRAIRPAAEATTGDWWRQAVERYGELPDETKAQLSIDVSLLVERLTVLDDGEPGGAWVWARRLAELVERNEEMLRLGPFSPLIPRDRAMAETAFWVLGRLPPGERAVYWAHNAHVQRVRVAGPALPAGSFVGAGHRFAVVLGDQYLAIGTAYGGPARDDGSPPLEDSVDAALAQVGLVSFIVPLAVDEAPQAVVDWVRKPRPMRYQAGYLEVPLGDALDAIAYFEAASPALHADVP